MLERLSVKDMHETSDKYERMWPEYTIRNRIIGLAMSRPMTMVALHSYYIHSKRMAGMQTPDVLACDHPTRIKMRTMGHPAFHCCHCFGVFRKFWPEWI